VREPWFSIIDVTECRGRSIADIARDIIERRKVSLDAVRGQRRDKTIVTVRHEIIDQVRRERIDLTSGHLARFLNRDPATIRHYWRKAAA
jgi:chromosomal replication initiation ATPase DnaA